MDFGLSERETMWRDRVRTFMADRIYPAIPIYQQQTAREGAARWSVIPIVEELKARAFSEGLWNPFGGTLVQVPPATGRCCCGH